MYKLQKVRKGMSAYGWLKKFSTPNEVQKAVCALTKDGELWKRALRAVRFQKFAMRLGMKTQLFAVLHEKLLLIDLICYGVGSPYVFRVC